VKYNSFRPDQARLLRWCHPLVTVLEDRTLAGTIVGYSPLAGVTPPI
jgi:hypothetical protein